MIRELAVRNFAIITELVLPLGPGMIALTGETGAGKSILVDALGLVLGDRGDAGLIRHGQERAEVSAVFETGENEALLAWLRTRDLEPNGDCILRRVLSRQGRSRAYINGRPVPIHVLREAGGYLVEIHGQHAHQSLLRPAVQRTLLDAYGAHGPLLRELGAAYRRWRQLRRELETLTETADERDSRLALARYQVEELEAFRPEPGELERQEREHQRLAHAAELVQGADAVMDRLYQNEQHALYGLLGQAARRITQLQAIDPELSGVTELINGAAIQIEEAAGELRRYLDDAHMDPERLAWVEERLSGFYELARKHRVAASELPALLERLTAGLADLETLDGRLDSLRRKLAEAAEAYRTWAARLSEARAKAAAELEQGVTRAMQTLAMPGGHLKVNLAPLPGRDFSSRGAEQVEFQVSANPGYPPAPLNKVASGGELSRIGLAIQMLTSRLDGVSTQVFDEVDAGIGGAVADVVGARLQGLGERRQVLCVTHLPQVAVQAHTHIRIRKQQSEATATVELIHLNEEERIEEIARMLGGRAITEQSRAHAREMREMARRGSQEGLSPAASKTR